MSFPKLLKQKQLELGMTATRFAKHIGRSRQFITLIYSDSENLKKCGLSELTMYTINEKLDIPFELMLEYNEKVKEHNERIKKSKSR